MAFLLILLMMKSCNLEVLRWVNGWGQVGSKKKLSQSQNNSFEPLEEKNSSFGSLERENSSFGPLERKILLLCGPPGLGKTTLAHMAAKTAGYSVVEINASDERIGESVINKITSAIQIQSIESKKPNMIIIDEIDGAASTNSELSLIKFLVGLCKSTSSNNNEESSGSRNKKLPINLTRPIICICNDLYAPALRPLRLVAQIVQVKPISPVQLAHRLKFICQQENLKINNRTLVDLAGSMDCDIRSTLHSLQFLSKRQQGISSNSTFQRDLSFGAFKDSIKTPIKIFEDIFKSSNRGSLDAGEGLGRQDDLISTLRMSGIELNKIMNGCFELYPFVKFFDSQSMNRLNQGLEAFSRFDLLSNPRNIPTGSGNEGRFDSYLSYQIYTLKTLFSSPIPTALKYPKQDYENHLKHTEFNSILRDYRSSLPPDVKSLYSSERLVLERIPFLLNVIQIQSIKSSNPQLMRPEDRQRLNRIVEVIASEGLAYRQIKLDDGINYKFLIDPPIDRFNHQNGPESTQDSLTYSVYRLISFEVEQRKIRLQKLKPAKAKKSAETNEPDPSMINQTARAFSLNQRPAALKPEVNLRILKDFFGRPLPKPAENKQRFEHTANHNKGDHRFQGTHIWYVHNDGVSNAARRNVKISSFLAPQ